MGASIVDIQNMGDALRNTGYKVANGFMSWNC